MAADITAFPPAHIADFDGNGFLDPQDINQLNAALRQEEPDLLYDVNRDGKVNGADRTFWIEVIHRSYAGDANLDGEFDTGDLVGVLQAGLYEDATPGNASWESGDWDGDGDFETGDLVVALQGGGFEVGPRPLQRPQIKVLPSDEVLRGDPEANWDELVIEGQADPFSVVRLQETGAAVMADANGNFRLERALLNRVETLFTVSVSDLRGRALPEVATTHLRLGLGSIEAGYVTPSSFHEKPALSPEDLPASLATVYLPDGMDGRKLVEQYVTARGVRPDQGNPVPVLLPADTPVIEEQPEEPGQDPNLAPQIVSDFGSGLDQIPAVVIQGMLEPLPRVLESAERLDGTDDGDIGKAIETELTAGAAVRIEARIGDGPHGSQGTGKGDSDFFVIRDLEPEQLLVIDVNTPVGSELDSFVFVYDANGNLLDFNDDNGSSLDSYLVHRVRAAGTYYVSVAAFGTYGPVYPTESASGLGVASEGDYELFLAVNPDQEIDVYAFDLQPGDILGATVLGGPNHLTLRDEFGEELIGSGQDITLYHPTNSPLPAGGNVSLSWVVGAPGTYQLAVDGGFGEYSLELAVFRPVLESGERGQGQILFLDFDGGTLNAESLFGIGNPEANLSPLSAFLENWGLEPTDEEAVISAIVATVRENFADVGARGNNGDFASDRVDGHFGIEIVTSRESTDLFGFPLDPFGAPDVSRVIIGGTMEQLGISTIGIAESVDVGNFHTTDTGVVLLDLLSAPSSNPNSLNRIQLDEQNVSIIDLIGVAVGNIVTHEAGHFFAAWHTNQFNSVPDLMDQGGNLANTIGLVGPVFGDGDEINVSFGRDVFVSNEGFTGTQDSLNAVSFGLSTGTEDPGMRVISSVPASNRPLLEAPTEFVVEFLDPFVVTEDIWADTLTVNGLPADEVEVAPGEQPDAPRKLVFRFQDSPVVQPGRQVLELSEGAVQRLSDGDLLQAYQMEFGFNPTPINVVSVTPIESLVTLPLESVRVAFSEAYDPQSVDVADLVLSQGAVSAFEFVDERTVEYQLTGVEREERLRISLPDGAITDAYGNLATGFDVEYTTDYGQVALTAFQSQNPRGSLVYNQVVNGFIDSGDVDTFSVAVDGGQTLAILLTTDEGLQADVKVRSQDRIVAESQALAAGQPLVVQSDPVSGRLIGRVSALTEYLIEVAGVAESSGLYSLQVVLNAAVEEEDFAGALNNTPESSVDLETIFAAPLVADGLDSSLVASASAAQRAALTGSLTGPERFVESFENGAMPVDSWTFRSTSDFGRIQVTDEYGAADGRFALLMDVARGPVTNLNEAIWDVDLSGVERPILAFSHVSFGDERQPFVSPFTGSYNADGIAVSVDGTRWYPVFNAPDTTRGEWNRFHVDLAERASAAGISLDGPVQIKFQQFDNSPLEDDGRGWDHIVLHESDDADWLRLSLRARESVSLLGTVEGQGDLKVELFDAQGNWLAEGISPPSPLRNGSFETGDFQHWIVEVDGQSTRPWQVSGGGVFNSLLLDRTDPQDGDFVAWNWFNGTGPVEFRMYQDLVIPENVPQARLSWQQRLQWAFSNVNQKAGEFSVELLKPESNELLDVLYAFSTGDADIQQMFGDTEWQTQFADISDYAGQTVRLMFRDSVSDGSEFNRAGQLELDNIRLDLASPWPANVDDLVRGFIAPATGTYYVRVSGTPQTQYSLVATRNTEFDLEPNDSSATAQALLVPDVGGRQWLMGAIEGTGGSDYYQLLLEGGQPLNVETFTPAAGPGQFQNALDPMIVLYDAAGNIVASDDNSASDGRNAALRYRVPRGEEGIFYLAVVAGTSGIGIGEGEYYLSVRGSSIPESVLSLLAAAAVLETDSTADTEETPTLELAVDGGEPTVAETATLLEQSVADWLPDVFEEYDGLDEVAEEVSGLIDWDADLLVS